MKALNAVEFLRYPAFHHIPPSNPVLANRCVMQVTSEGPQFCEFESASAMNVFDEPVCQL